jgi:hypothetical protein
MMLSVRLTISKDDPCLFITAVAKNRLPVFQSDALKVITCGAIDEARTSCSFLLFALGWTLRLSLWLAPIVGGPRGTSPRVSKGVEVRGADARIKPGA